MAAGAFEYIRAISLDATLVEEGKASAEVASSRLWRCTRPEPLNILWQEMNTSLLAEKQDWDVWIDWYEDRLSGRPTDREREFAYVAIRNELWNKGPALVNAEIKRRIGKLESKISILFPGEPARNFFVSLSHRACAFARKEVAFLWEKGRATLYGVLAVGVATAVYHWIARHFP